MVSRATLRKHAGLLATQVKDEAKKIGITVDEYYAAAEMFYNAEREEKKTQTKNNRAQKKVSLKAAKDFFSKLTPEPVTGNRAERLANARNEQTYFVEAKYWVNIESKNGQGRLYNYRSHQQSFFTIKSSRMNLFHHLIENIKNECESLTTPYETYEFLQSNKVKYNIMSRDQFTPLATRDLIDRIRLRRAGVLKYDFMPTIDNISFETTEMKCVYQTLVAYYKPEMKKISEDSLFKFFQERGATSRCSDFATTKEEGVSPEMIAAWCESKNITYYMFDINNYLFKKHVVPANNRNYKPLVMYAVDEHMYIITNKELIKKIAMKFADNKSGKAFLTNTMEDDGVKGIIGTIYDDLTLEQLDALGDEECTVIYQKPSLTEFYYSIIKATDTIPKARYKSKYSVAEIEYGNKRLMLDPCYGTQKTWRDVKALCEKLGIVFYNQGIGSLVTEYHDRIAGLVLQRLLWTKEQREEIKLKFGGRCSCGCTTGLQIDHVEPLACGGTNDMDNLQLLCKPCHYEKSKNERDNNQYFKLNPITSSFNDRVRKTFDSPLMMKWAFCEYVKRKIPKHGYDVNKCRKNIMYYSKYEWPVYTVMDDVQPFSGVMRCGFFYVESENSFPLRGNGWYTLPMIKYCLRQNIISADDIKYELIPSFTLEATHFREFIDNVYANFGDMAKLAINARIGCFWRKDYDVVRGISPTRSFQEACYMFGQYNATFATYNEELKMYQVFNKTEVHAEDTEAPLYLQVLDMEAVELHRLAKIVKRQGGEVIRLKTDCVQTDTKINIEKYEWVAGVPKYKYEEVPQKYGPECKPRLRRELDYYLYNTEWKVITDPGHNDFASFAARLKGKSFHLDGAAGCGKSSLIKAIIKSNGTSIVPPDDGCAILTLLWMGSKCEAVVEELDGSAVLNTLCLAPTKIAANIIGGNTLHKFAGGFCSKMKHLSKKLIGIHTVIVDEISMVPEYFYKMLLTMKHIKPELNFIIAGDFGQLKPVKDRVGDVDYINSRVLFELCGGVRVQLSKCRRADDKLFNMYMDPENVDIGVFGTSETYINICKTNKMRKAVNRRCMERFSAGKNVRRVSAFKIDPQSQDMVLSVGTPIMARVNNEKLDLCNNEMYTVVELKRNSVIIDTGLEVELDQFSRFFHVAFAFTVHKSQGKTFTEPFTIWEWKRYDTRMKYVALSRGTCVESINIV